MNLKTLHGQWFIHFTNFPMWLKGDKINPSITYGHHKDVGAMTDQVGYFKRSTKKEHHIHGVDRITAESKNQFKWRGTGLLCLLSSEWQIDYLSEAGSDQWMIISFQKSLFTPAGHDILCRQAVIDEELAKQMLRKFEALHPGTKVHGLMRSL